MNSDIDIYLWVRYGKNDKLDWLRERFIRQQRMIDALLDHFHLEFYENESGVRVRRAS